MRETRDTVKLIEASLVLGYTLSEAVQRALGHSLSEFARERGHSRSAVSMCLTNYNGRVFANVRDDLALSLAIPREYLDRLIDQQNGSVAA
jgi:hypothetical protein